MTDATEFTGTLTTTPTQQERKMINDCTKDALQVAKANGKRLGNPDGTIEIRHLGNAKAVTVIERGAYSEAPINASKAEGITTVIGIATALDGKHMLTQRGSLWATKGVTRPLACLG